MRSALICVFLALFVPKGGTCAENEQDFRPTPIPLSDWPRDRPENAGTLQEIIKTEAPPTVAAVPAHYWEDALRHSVYLALVRDKIDQLIANGDVISPDSRPTNNVAKEIDDHDLWEKIKTARFDRLKEEPIPPAEVTIIAKGRLMEENGGYRFAEDNATSDSINCSDNNCTKGVKAYWSVKRIRQGETSPGKYHYELTFAVSSQTKRKLKKPYENPTRTFTIKESSPTDPPEVRYRDNTYHHVERPQRALWFHRNINHAYRYKRPVYSRGLDRIFSSLFSDEDGYEEPTYRHKHKSYPTPTYPQYAKVGFVDDSDPYYQKKQMPYPVVKPQPYRHTHSPVSPPPVQYVQHPYLNVEPFANIPYGPPYTDNRYVPSNVVKTTRPAVLPTPVTNYPLRKESTVEVPVKTKLNTTEYTTKVPDIVTTHRMYNNHKQSPMKVKYFPDHIRPPVYNAPPGVFVTMDKKPFKPMPPLKFGHSNKPPKMLPPDFRPSPQVLDTQFSEQDSAGDTAFRPITMNYTELSNSQEMKDKVRKSNKNNRKPNVTKKPTKKLEHIKSHRLTTASPEIITALSQSIEEDNAMEWANLLGAFTKTTPMASNRERGATETSDPITTTPLSITFSEDELEDVDSFSTAAEKSSTSSSTTTTSTTTTTTTTTPKPKKRTRPPPKFTKQEKIKKHKRVTSTTASTTMEIPTRTPNVKKSSDDLKPQASSASPDDLTPQASSAATSATNSVWETKTHKAPVTTTISSTTPRPTTTMKLTTSGTSTTTSTSSSIVDTEQPVATTQPKSKNRFRQSTLMHKGTSVNHDKWSTNTLDKNRTNSVSSTKFPLRRKASKFQGYIPSSTPRSPEVERDKEDHRDYAYNTSKESTIKTTTEQTNETVTKTPLATQPTHAQQDVNFEPVQWPHDDETEEDDDSEGEHSGAESDVHASKDDKEYIFPTASTTHEVEAEYITLEKQPITTQGTDVTSPHSAANKTKCKKKKHNNLTTTQEALKPSSEDESSGDVSTSIPTTTTASAVTPDIFADLFGGFTMDDVTEKPKTENVTPSAEQKQSESEKHERYVHIDDDLEDFLHSLDQKSNHQPEDSKSEEEYNDEDEIDYENSPFNIEEENSDSRSLSDEYYDDTAGSQERPFSLLELMAIE